MVLAERHGKSINKANQTCQRFSNFLMPRFYHWLRGGTSVTGSPARPPERHGRRQNEFRDVPGSQFVVRRKAFPRTTLPRLRFPDSKPILFSPPIFVTSPAAFRS
jgi:hypothetical protein